MIFRHDFLQRTDSITPFDGMKFSLMRKLMHSTPEDLFLRRCLAPLWRIAPPKRNPLLPGERVRIGTKRIEGVRFLSRDPPLSSSFVELNNSVTSQRSCEDAPRGIIKECGGNPEEVAVTLARTRFSLYSTLANAFASLTFTDAPRGGPAAAVLPRARGWAPRRRHEKTSILLSFSLSSRHRRITERRAITTVSGGARDTRRPGGRWRAIASSTPMERHPVRPDSARRGASSTGRTLGRTVTTSSPTASRLSARKGRSTRTKQPRGRASARRVPSVPYRGDAGGDCGDLGREDLGRLRLA